MFINKNNIYKTKKILGGLFLSVYAVVFMPMFAFAQLGGSLKINAKIDNPLKIGTLSDFISEILKIVVTIGTPIAILAIIYSGFLFVKAQGNETELAKAKEAFFWTIVGVLVLLGAQAIGIAIGGTITAISK